MATTIKRGENVLIRRNLFQSDGSTALQLTDCDLITLELIQNGTVLKTWNKTLTVYDTGFRQGTSSSQIEAELTIDESNSLPTGSIDAHWTFEVVDSDFIIDGVQHDEQYESPILIVKD